MFEIKDLNIMINDNQLVKSLSLTLNKNDKLAIIGEEGNGKTTLLKSILGICNYVTITGNINFNKNTVGYLKQNLDEEELSKTVYNYLFKDEEDYYNKVNVFYKYMNSLKIDDNLIESVISTLSGGEKIKVGILKLLLDEKDILFLDEPTNDLDLDALDWLERFINTTDKPIIYVSHDETLLSNTANMILHFEQVKNKSECRHTLVKIGYDDYVSRRLNSIRKQNQISMFEKKEHNKKLDKLNQIMQKVEHQQATITRANPHGGRLLKKKMHALKSQEKKLDDAIVTEPADVEEEINVFFEDVSLPRNKKIIDLKIDELKMCDKVLSKNIKLEVYGSEHICIVGKNGAGKTTLIKRIYNELMNRQDIKIGYMPQNYDEILCNYHSALEFMCKTKLKDDITKTMTFLGSMNFTTPEMIGDINNLSGGSKAKLFIAKLIIDKCDVLLLDEPTRNVSPLSNPVIRNNLKGFNGCIISVSHDRKYINDVSNTIYRLNQEGLIKLAKEV